MASDLTKLNIQGVKVS